MGYGALPSMSAQLNHTIVKHLSSWYYVGAGLSVYLRVKINAIMIWKIHSGVYSQDVWGPPKIRTLIKGPRKMVKLEEERLA